MTAPNRTERPNSASTLAGASVGDDLLIEEIPLPLLRARCRKAGISAGDRVRVEDRSGWTVAIRNGAGRSVRLAPVSTIFICVKKTPEQDEPADAIGKSEPPGHSARWIGTEKTDR